MGLYKKKILLIQPEAKEAALNFHGILKVTGRRALRAPLSLATIAGLTPGNYEVRILDESVREIDFDIKCDVVGLTGFSCHVNRMIEIAKEFRKKGRIVVAGGVGCNVHCELCRPYFDVIFFGECEYVWPQFLCDYENGHYQDSYHGGKDIDLSDSPIPRWDLLKIEKYTILSIQTSRGCPYDCEFCDIVAIFGRRIRVKSIEQVMLEVKQIGDFGRREIFFSDDNFVMNKKHTKSLLEELIKFNKNLKHPIKYSTQVTIDIAVDEELLDMMRDANFSAVFIGIETPNKESLIETNKAHNLKMDLIEAVNRIQSRGIFIMSGGMIGFDHDDKNIFNLFDNFLTKAGLPIPVAGLMVARKGTKLWNRLEQEGRLLKNVSQDDFGRVNYHPKLMSKEQLEYGFMQFQVTCELNYQKFIKRFQNFIDQVNIKNINQQRLIQTTIYKIVPGIRIILYFLFNKDYKNRQLFIEMVKIAKRKNKLFIPWAFEMIVFFISRKEFVESSDAYNAYLANLESTHAE